MMHDAVVCEWKIGYRKVETCCVEQDGAPVALLWSLMFNFQFYIADWALLAH